MGRRSVRAVIVRLARGLEGAAAARGDVVIVDVFRAMTSAAVLLARGVAELLWTPDVAEALRWRATGRVDVCAGEVEGRPPPGFDHGNSPAELLRAPVVGRRVVLSTRAGAAGLAAAAPSARRLWGAALVTLEATACALRAMAPEMVTIVAMGWAGRERTAEDELCARALAARLEGRRVDGRQLVRRLRASPEARKFGDPARPWFAAEDLEIALDLDRYEFAIAVARGDDGVLRSRAVPAEGTGDGGA
ncbi:MAG: 2-phosphosulfolactate phosphatase [Kiritimatiellae bacterium]|nr:2-phosphosulfolactate phosphatase [Kiritimatiellia bacterium]